MGVRPRLGILCVGCFLLLGSSAWAAMLEPVQGDLYINQGQGFQLVTGPVDANVGDSIMVAPGGSAKISYAGGCNVNVQPGDVATITKTSPCTNPFAHTGAFDQDNVPGNPALGWAMTGTALGAAGLGVGIYAITKNNNNGTTINTCGSASNPCFTEVSPSDARLKRDIALVQRLDDGLGLYRYRYLWSDTVYVGVMAQEVALVHPDAVVRDGLDDYLRVDYGRLGLKLMTLPQWEAASKGERL